jgi:uncharacterized protein YukE
MGLRDESGQIVINEREANEDIANLRRARQSLEEFRKSLTTARTRLGTAWAGNSFNSFTSKNDALIKDVDRVISQINTSIKNIEDTVRHYQEVDRRLAEEAQRSADDIKSIAARFIGGFK